MIRVTANAVASAALLLLGMAGCATTTETSSLDAARQAYLNAQYGPAARYAPVDFDARGFGPRPGRAALARAPRLRRSRHASPTSRSAARSSRALMAARRSRRCNVTGRSSRPSRRRASGSLRSARSSGGRTRRSRQPRPRRRRRQRRGPEIRHEERGDVITVTGAVLFAHGSAEIQPAARETLDRVARPALRNVPDRKIVVEGYTDSTGDPGTNERLSLARAEAVQEVPRGPGRDVGAGIDAAGPRSPAAGRHQRHAGGTRRQPARRDRHSGREAAPPNRDATAVKGPGESHSRFEYRGMAEPAAAS